MATIHMLKLTTPARPAAPPAMKKSAEIIIFPGVRYERWVEPKPVATVKPKRKRATRVKRDRLVISI